MHIIAALDPDLVKLLERFAKVLEDVSALDTQVKFGIAAIIALCAILRFIGWPELKKWVSSEMQAQMVGIRKEIQTSIDQISKDSDAEMKRMLGEQKKSMEASTSLLAKYVEEAGLNNARIAQYAEDADRVGQSMMLRWEAGVVDVNFGKEGYRSDWKFFTKAFPKPPIVLVSDSLPHAWLLVKTDEINEKGFKWATTILGGPRPDHHSKIQWLAVLPVERPSRTEPMALEDIKHLLDDLEKKLKPDRPNKAPEPTSGTVTPPAEPGVAPVPPVAHLYQNVGGSSMADKISGGDFE